MSDHMAATGEHILSVQVKIARITQLLNDRALKHDQSKLEEPEASIFAEVTPRLRSLTYGSEEYKQSLQDLGPALEHHYQNNSHHPEHYVDGLQDMCLVDVVEMFCDWLAATERHEDGDILKSIDINEKRFNVPPTLSHIFRNTLKHFENAAQNERST